MSRLTEKKSIIPRDMMNAEYAKLADLEDIEEELGIDLVTLFKALKNGIYIYNSRKEIKYVQSVAFQNGVITFNISGLYVELKDYRKTWGLAKEELENGSN